MRKTLLRRGVYGHAKLLLCASAAALTAGTGCGTLPAKPVESAAHSPVLAPNGEYVATIYTRWAGPVKSRFIAERTESGFRANTPPGVAWALIGGAQGTLGPLFAPFLFPRGMVLTWESTWPRENQPGAGTIGVGTLDSMRARTALAAPGGVFEVRLKDGRLVGCIGVEELTDPPRARSADYSLLAAEVERAVREKLYDPAISESAQTRAFVQDVKAAAAKAQDDLEFMFGAVMAGRSHMRFQQPLLYPGQVGLDGALSAKLNETTPTRVKKGLSHGIVEIRADAFAEPELLEETLREASAANPTGIVLNLRTGVGVDLSSLQVASWLTPTPMEAGIFFGSKRRADVLAGRTQDIALVEITDAASVRDLWRVLWRDDAARVVVMPRPDGFRGPVAVQTSKRTASTCEHLVWILRHNGRAVVLGEPTAGRPLVSDEADLGQGWLLRIASYDWRAPDGSTFAGKGVQPHRRVTKSEIDEACIRELRIALSLPDQPAPVRPEANSSGVSSLPSEEATTAAHAASPETLMMVRVMSSSRSTARMTAMPSLGMPMASSTTTISAMLAPGSPGEPIAIKAASSPMVK